MTSCAPATLRAESKSVNISMHVLEVSCSVQIHEAMFMGMNLKDLGI